MPPTALFQSTTTSRHVSILPFAGTHRRCRVVSSQFFIAIAVLCLPHYEWKILWPFSWDLTDHHTQTSVFKLGDENHNMMRIEVQPGFSWTRDVKPFKEEGKKNCSRRHIGMVLEGEIWVTYEESGESFSLDKDSMYDLQPGVNPYQMVPSVFLQA